MKYVKARNGRWRWIPALEILDFIPKGKRTPLHSFNAKTWDRAVNIIAENSYAVFPKVVKK